MQAAPRSALSPGRKRSASDAKIERRASALRNEQPSTIQGQLGLTGQLHNKRSAGSLWRTLAIPTTGARSEASGRRTLFRTRKISERYSLVLKFARPTSTKVQHPSEHFVFWTRSQGTIGYASSSHVGCLDCGGEKDGGGARGGAAAAGTATPLSPARNGLALESSNRSRRIGGGAGADDAQLNETLWLKRPARSCTFNPYRSFALRMRWS